MASMVIPVEYLVIGIGVPVLGLMGLIMFLLNLKLYAPEAFIFRSARLKNLPVLDLVDVGTGESRFLLGTKADIDDIAFDTGHYGIQVDPSLVSGNCDPSRYTKGLKIFHYCTTRWLPITPQNVLAIQTVKRIRDEKYPDLLFLTDLELMSLLNAPRTDLMHDASRYIEKYRPVSINGDMQSHIGPDELIRQMVALQDELVQTPVDTGFFAYHHAFKDIPFAHASQDLEQLKLLIQRKVFKQFENRDKTWTYALCAVAVLGAVAVVIYVISMAASNVGS